MAKDKSDPKTLDMFEESWYGVIPQPRKGRNATAKKGARQQGTKRREIQETNQESQSRQRAAARWLATLKE